MLKPLVTLFHLKTYRDKLVSTCLPEPADKDQKKLLSTWDGGQLREWRWSSLTEVLRALLKREDALKQQWQSNRFGKHGPADGVDKALACDMFWAYARFLALVSGMIDAQSEWCEGCSCYLFVWLF